MRYNIVYLLNPKAEAFTWKYDGEAYTVPGLGLVPLVSFVADHLYSHNSFLEIYTDESIADARLELVRSGKKISKPEIKIEELPIVDNPDEAKLAEEAGLEPVPQNEEQGESEDTGFRESGDKATSKPKRKK